MGPIVEKYGGSSVRDPDHIRNVARCVLEEGGVAVIAGFQGIDDEGDVSPLGRGGSDRSALALATAMGADVCAIDTDADGVFTADPNLVPAVRRELDPISYDEVIEMASLGAKVLQIRSVQFAMRYGVPLPMRSTSKWIEVSVGIDEGQMERALKVLHAAFVEAGAAEPES